MSEKKSATLDLSPSAVIKKGIWLLVETCRLQPTHHYLVQFTRSLVVSVAALAVDFTTLVLLKEKLHVYYLAAATVSFLFGVIVNYYLSIWWVFANRKLASKHAEFVIFVVICALGLAINLLIIAGSVEFFHLDYRIAKAIATVVVFFWNFLVRKKILY